MPRLHAGIAAALVVAALPLAGCGDDGGTKTIVERTVTVVTTPPPTTATTTTETPSGSTKTPSATPERCADIADIGPTGADPADAVNVTVTYTDCETAERLARRFYSVWIPSGAGPGEFVTVGEFRCGEMADSGDFTARVVCSRSASEVRFDLP